MIQRNALIQLCIILALLCTALPQAAAQTTGLYRFGSFEGSPDLINLSNLNAHLSIPIRHKAGRQMNFDYALNFDATVLAPLGTAGSQAWTMTLGGGWQGSKFAPSADAFSGVRSTYQLLSTCTYNGTQYSVSAPSYAGATFYISNFYYIDMAGLTHALPGTINAFQCGPSNPTTYTYNGFGPAGDGSGISSVIDSNRYPQNGTDQPVPSISVPNLTTLHNTSYGSNEVDRNGNEITFNATSGAYNGISSALGSSFSLGSYTNTLNQTALTIDEQNVMDASGKLTSGSITFSYPDGNGANSQYALHYVPYSIASSFNCPSTSEVIKPNVFLPDYLIQPDGRQYTFTYEQTPAGNGTVTGRIASIGLPDGGTVSYIYTSTNCQGSPSLLQRTVNDNNGNVAKWVYSNTPNADGTSTTVLTDPTANDSVLIFGGNHQMSRTDWSGSSTGAGTPLQTVVTTYNFLGGGQVNAATGGIIGRKITTSIPTPSAGKSRMVTETYDVLGSLTQQSLYDYGTVSGGPGPLLSQHIRAYDPVDDVFEVPAATIDISGDGQYVIQTIFGLDGANLVSTTGVGQHVASLTTNRGNVTSVMRMSAGPGNRNPQPVVSNYTYYDTGQVASATDPTGSGVTSYTYGQCNSSFPTTVSQTVQPSGIVLTSSAAWDCNGGVPTSSTDVNGNTSTMLYKDSLWRLTSSTDALGNEVDIKYPTVASNTSSMETQFAGGLPGTQSVTTYDGLGRSILTQRRQGPAPASSYSSSATRYDLRGMPVWTSNLYSGTKSQYVTTGSGVTKQFDALGRPYSITDTGGGTLSYGYSLNDVSLTVGPAVAGENVKSRQLEYNGAGQLISVCEATGAAQSGACGQSTAASGYATTYSYSGDLLTQVSQNVQGGSPVQQHRLLNYDGTGRLTSEVNPETGTSTYVYDRDPSGGCPGSFPGSVIAKTDNLGNKVCLTYDSLNRTLSSQVVSGPYAAITPQTHFVYDAASLNGQAMQNAKGTLAEAYTCSGGCTTKLTDIFTESYPELSNGKPTGRSYALTFEATPNSGGYYQTQQIVNSNGTPSSLTATLNNAAFGFPAVSYGRDSFGRVSSVSDTSANATLVSSTIFDNLTGVVQGVTFGNGDSDSFGFDPTTNRPTSFGYAVGGPNAFNIAGSLNWNPNGSLQNFTMNDSSDASKNQNCAYQMDDLNRLSQVSCAGSWAQAFSYDPFGNISKGAPANPQPGQITSSYSAGYMAMSNGTQIDNNRVQYGVNAAYDGNGNQTQSTTSTLSWNASAQAATVNGVTGTYDALGRLVETGSGNLITSYVYGAGGAKLASVQSGHLISGTVSLPGGEAAVYLAGGFDHFRHSDWLGSGRLSTTWNHQVSSKTAYAPFGETYNTAGVQEPTFTGQTQDSAPGVYDYLFRKYDPVAGRWLSPDPKGWAATSLSYPQSLNRYAYVQNDPMRATDPSGLACVYFKVDGSVSVILPLDCASSNDDGYYVEGTGVTGALLDGNGDLEFYGTSEGLFNPDGSQYSDMQSVTVSTNFDSPITGATPNAQTASDPGLMRPGAPSNVTPTKAPYGVFCTKWGCHPRPGPDDCSTTKKKAAVATATSVGFRGAALIPSPASPELGAASIFAAGYAAFQGLVLAFGGCTP